MGSGKSVVGALVAERAGAPFHDLDLMVEDEAGMTIPDIFATQGEAAFRALEKAILPRALEPGAVVALGGGVVIERRDCLFGPFDRPAQRMVGKVGGVEKPIQ